MDDVPWDYWICRRESILSFICGEEEVSGETHPAPGTCTLALEADIWYQRTRSYRPIQIIKNCLCLDHFETINLPSNKIIEIKIFKQNKLLKLVFYIFIQNIRQDPLKVPQWKWRGDCVEFVFDWPWPAGGSREEEERCLLAWFTAAPLMG